MTRPSYDEVTNMEADAEQSRRRRKSRSVTAPKLKIGKKTWMEG